MAVSLYGAALAIGGLDGTILFCDIRKNKEDVVFRAVHGGVRALALSPDATTLAAVDGPFLVSVDTRTHLVRSSRRIEEGVVTTLRFSPDGHSLVATGRDRAIRIWDVATGQTQAVFRGHTGWIHPIAIAPDGSMIASPGANDGLVRIWDVPGRRLRGLLKGPPCGVRGVAFAPDGKSIATGHGRGTIILWNSDTLRERVTFRSPGLDVCALAFSQDGQKLISGGADSSLRIWDLARLQRD